jgi:hypothetical protein
VTSSIGRFAGVTDEAGAFHLSRQLDNGSTRITSRCMATPSARIDLTPAIQHAQTT